ncbi:hypothetical protein BH11PAT1_BH11PAT1_7400 [soil metagenome]
MADNSQKGLGSDNMDPQTKHDIQSEGGKASHSGGNTSGQKGGQSSSNTSNRGLGSENMDPQTKHDIQSEGGKASHQNDE